MENKIFTCTCSSLEHSFVISYDNEFTYIEIHLSKKSFLKRFIHGIKYICGYKCKYGSFDEILLDDKQLADLVDYLLEIQNKNN